VRLEWFALISFVVTNATVAVEDVIGRIVMRHGISDWPVYKSPARVTGFTEGSLEVSRLHANASREDERWIFTDQTSGDFEFISLEAVALVCDTADEVNAINLMNRKSITEYTALKDKLAAEFHAIRDEFNNRPMPTPATRVEPRRSNRG
jgi:hypothetical protein